MKGLTQRQLQVLEAIANSLSESGYPPTIREIGNSLGIRSTNGVNDHLKALEKKGYIERDTSKSRAIQMTSLATHELGLDTSAGAANADREGPSNEGVAVPLLGRIAAGLPLDAADAAEDHVVVDPGMFGRAGSNNVFALRVKGESMIEDGILDGDVIFVRQQSDAARGEMVAVWMDGGATVKRFYRDAGVVRLEPSNATMEPIYIRPGEGDEAQVLGKVVGVYRQLV